MRYFGTDGIRGTGEYIISIAYRLGLSLGLLGVDNLLIASDTRISKDLIKENLIQGAKEAGLNIYDLDILPTPALLYLSGVYKSLGIMITASHNPYTDNGIKVLKYGNKINKDEELKLEEVIDGGDYQIIHPNSSISPNLDSYMHKYEMIKDNHKLNILFDFANGATYLLGQKIFDGYKFISNTPNGININNRCGSTHLENLKNHINGYDLGFAFDGDGDRVLAVLKDGFILDGDLLIYIIASYLKDNNKLENNGCVLTTMSNLAIIEALNKKDIRVFVADVGDKNVLDLMNKEGLILGGENSGHIINLSLLNTGDGMLNAKYIIDILEKHPEYLDEVRNIKLYPEKLTNIKIKDKSVIKNESFIKKLENYKKELGTINKIIVRASGTEDLIRISVSAKKLELVDEYTNKIIEDIKELIL